LLTTPRSPAEGSGFLDWLLRSRQTGRITVAQFPNWPLGVWLLATISMLVVHPTGGVRDLLVVIAWIALGLWAADEVLRGVNPLRRLLGAIVLTWLIVSVVVGS
jgi:hypothetical protein